MKRFHARVAVVEALKKRGDYIETKDNPMNVPVCAYVDCFVIDLKISLLNVFLFSSRAILGNLEM